MKTKQIITHFATLICLFSAIIQVSAQQDKETKSLQFQLEISRSKILWHAPKNHGGSNHYGFLRFQNGNLQSSISGVPTSATFIINMNSISSTDHKVQKDNEKVDAQLKSDDFFDVARFPMAVITVKQITKTEIPNIFAVNANLTMKGITNSISFKAMIKKINNQIKVTANLKIDRLKWNVKNMGGDLFGKLKNNMIEEEIPIWLDLIFKN